MKVDNILVESIDPVVQGPRVKLADFGFAKELSPDGKERIILGSRLCMAPELIRKEEYTNKVDIWAVGVLAYYLWTYGKYPFPGITKEVVNNKIKTQEPEMALLQSVGCPRETQDFIRKCLAKDSE